MGEIHDSFEKEHRQGKPLRDVTARTAMEIHELRQEIKRLRNALEHIAEEPDPESRVTVESLRSYAREVLGIATFNQE